MTLPLLLSAVLAGFAQAPPVYPVPVAASTGNPYTVEQDRVSPPVCVAAAQWLNDTQMQVNRSAAQSLTLFTAVSRSAYCSAYTTLSAAFFDGNGAVVCSGVVDLRLEGERPVAYFHIEVRPNNVYELVRWSNGPRSTSQQWSRLSCITPNGQSEAQPADLERAQSLRLHAVVLPSNSGLATAELRMILQP